MTFGIGHIGSEKEEIQECWTLLVFTYKIRKHIANESDDILTKNNCILSLHPVKHSRSTREGRDFSTSIHTTLAKEMMMIQPFVY
jgi:hypothetical protein